jgi:hypothetical protein
MASKPRLAAAAAMVHAAFAAIPVAVNAQKHTSPPTATWDGGLDVVSAAALWDALALAGSRGGQDHVLRGSYRKAVAGITRAAQSGRRFSARLKEEAHGKCNKHWAGPLAL